MKTFKEFLLEQKETIRLFHGTHISNLDDVKRRGIRGNPSRKGSKEGYVFLSPKPDVAFGYGFMAGESDFHTKRKGKGVPDLERALVVVDMPKEWYDEHFVKSEGGLLPEVSFDDDIPKKFISNIVIGDRKEVYKYL